ncbi:hypothetical protein ABZP36_017409 [Zizania latifolia]
MADLHPRYRGDSFLPSSSASVPRNASAFAPAPGNGNGNPSLPEELYTIGRPPLTLPPPRRFALAPPAPSSSTPPPGASRRCGGRVRGVCVGCFGNPEAKRRRRVAGYKAYAVEGKVKASLRRGIRWFKRKCSGIFRV